MYRINDSPKAYYFDKMFEHTLCTWICDRFGAPAECDSLALQSFWTSWCTVYSQLSRAHCASPDDLWDANAYEMLFLHLEKQVIILYYTKTRYIKYTTHLPHISHLYFRTSLCTSMWTRKSHLSLNAFSQISHFIGRRFVCRNSCALHWWIVTKPFWQIEQLYQTIQFMLIFYKC